MKTILLVEDDAALARGIGLALQGETTQVLSSGTLADARGVIARGIPELIILDINLPDGSGLDFCREIREYLDTPILFLTANDTEMDVVAGLETGGDDYITKPFSLAVLRARVHVLLRRSMPPVTPIIKTGPFIFDFEAMRFTKESTAIELSKTEQILLRKLLVNRGIVLTREVLLLSIWPDGTDYVDENALSVAIRRLRTKLEDDPGHPLYIKTIRGIGYQWAVNI